MLNLLSPWPVEIYRKIICVHEPGCISGFVSYGDLQCMYVIT